MLGSLIGIDCHRSIPTGPVELRVLRPPPGRLHRPYADSGAPHRVLPCSPAAQTSDDLPLRRLPLHAPHSTAPNAQTSPNMTRCASAGESEADQRLPSEQC